MTAPQRRKLLILALTVVFVVTLLLLATSLTHLEFAPGKTYSFPPQAPIPAENPPPLPSNRWMDYLNLIFWSTAGALLIAAFVAMIVSKEHRRELLIIGLMVIIIGGLGWYLWFHAHPELQLPEPPPNRPAYELPQQPEEAPPVEVNPPHWSSFFLFLLILGAAGLLAWRFLPRLWRKESPLEGLADLAGEAAAELRGGAAVHDVVLRCYREMSELLSRRGHIPPDVRRALTAREFERELQRVGVRDEHITRLSRLFEQVRYGGRGTGEREAAEAISCLEAIEQAYGRGDGRGET